MITIKPEIATHLLPNEAAEWAREDYIPNNSRVNLDLSSLTFDVPFTICGIPHSITNEIFPVQYIITWPNGDTLTWTKQIGALDNWNKSIGPYHYSFNLSGHISHQYITIRIYDNFNNEYLLTIDTKVSATTVYDLNFNLQTEKIAYNGDIAMAVFRLEELGDTLLDNFDTPVISALT